MSQSSRSNDTYTLTTIVHAEGARVGFVTCLRCGSAILLRPDEEFDALAAHDKWHGHVESYRPDPRTAFIGG